MADNLAYKAESGCWAYENKPGNVKSYGYLNTWASDQKACPPGWHVATKEEWSVLITNQGGESIAPPISYKKLAPYIGSCRYQKL